MQRDEEWRSDAAGAACANRERGMGGKRAGVPAMDFVLQHATGAREPRSRRSILVSWGDEKRVSKKKRAARPSPYSMKKQQTARYARRKLIR